MSTGENTPTHTRRVFTIALNYALVLLVGALDYATGHEMHMGTFYLIVVAFAGWNLSPYQTFVHALATAFLWSGAEYLSGIHFSKWWLVYWNIFNHLGVVTIIALLVSKTKATYDRQQRLIRDLGQTLLKFSQFKELVPVCRLCHQYHLDDEYRARIEELVQEGTTLDTIGNVCPTCLEKRAAHVTAIPVASYFQTGTA